MAVKRVNVLVIDPSIVIRRGLMSVLLDMESLYIDVMELDDISEILQVVKEESPDMIIVNPLYLGMSLMQKLADDDVKLVALQSYMTGSDNLKGYDGVFSLTDSFDTIEQVMKKVSQVAQKPEMELSLREKDIVKAIALGQSNKEIAENLFISIHTVMTHRKNIASKLKIHNPAGLTIYAIVNKLIDIDDVK